MATIIHTNLTLEQISVENYGELASASSDNFLLPITHVVASTSFSASDLESTLEAFGTKDDVWSPTFGNSKWTDRGDIQAEF